MKALLIFDLAFLTLVMVTAAYGVHFRVLYTMCLLGAVANIILGCRAKSVIGLRTGCQICAFACLAILGLVPSEGDKRTALAVTSSLGILLCLGGLLYLKVVKAPAGNADSTATDQRDHPPYP